MSDGMSALSSIGPELELAGNVDLAGDLEASLLDLRFLLITSSVS